MKLFRLSLKNVFVRWWRSLTLGTFILFAGLLLIVLNSLTSTVQDNLADDLINALTGDIQVRPATANGDMFSLDNSNGSDNLIDAEKKLRIENVLKESTEILGYTQIIRCSAAITFGKEKQGAIIIGLNPEGSKYSKAFQLTEGRYLIPGNKEEMVLSRAQAEKLGVHVGDKVKIVMKGKDKKIPAITQLKVVGIGDVQLLGVFGFPVAYINIEGAQKLLDLSGYKKENVSDFLIYSSDKQTADIEASDIRSQLTAAGLSFEDVKVTSWKDMGGFIKGLISLFKAIFYGFIGVLIFIICILIVNLVIMMGVERRQEIGTLRAIGFSRYHIVYIFMGEILFISFFFCILGVLLGTGLVLLFSGIPIRAGSPINYIIGNEFYLKYYVSQTLPTFSLIIGFTFTAAFYPAFRASSLKPVETLKET